MGLVLSVQTFAGEYLKPVLIHTPAITVGRILTICSGLAVLVGVTYHISTRLEPDGVYERYNRWPKHVGSRLRKTFVYYGAALNIAALTMAIVSRSPTAMEFIIQNTVHSSWVFIFATTATTAMTTATQYKNWFGRKQLFYICHSVIAGCVLAPVTLFGTTALLQAAGLTAVLLSGCVIIIIFTAGDWIVLNGPPLTICTWAVSFATLANATYWPLNTTEGAHFYAISLYGGTVVYTWDILFQMKHMFRVCEHLPESQLVIYDPISMTVDMTLDTLKLFVRTAVLFSVASNIEKNMLPRLSIFQSCP